MHNFMFKRCMLVFMAAVFILSVSCGIEEVSGGIEDAVVLPFIESNFVYEADDEYKCDAELVFHVRSLYEARRVITDRDNWFGLFFTVSYGAWVVEQEEVFLEMLHDGVWERINYRNVNIGLMRSSWDEISVSELFLHEPLAAGRYRVRLIAYPFTVPRSSHRGMPGAIELVREFDIIAHEDAPEPRWNITRLELSPHCESDWSDGIRMTVANPVIDGDNTVLEVYLTADYIYTFGEHFRVEALLDGQWYKVPFANGVFFDVGFKISAGVRNLTVDCCAIDPVFRAGVLPAGHYRIIMEFSLMGDLMTEYGVLDWSIRNRIAEEFAMAEFVVMETLWSGDIYD